MGYRLIPLVDQAQGGDLLSESRALEKMSQEMGLMDTSTSETT